MSKSDTCLCVVCRDADHLQDNTADRGQDENQLLKVYDLVVKVALHQEGFKARKLSLTGPWEV